MAKISHKKKTIETKPTTTTTTTKTKIKRTRKTVPRDTPSQRAYDDEEAAAHTYDLAALKYWGQETVLNFPLSTYEEGIKEMEGLSKEEYIGSLRRKSSGFSRGVSKYRGVARHHHNGRWEARIGRVFGNKYLYLGTYATQEEAATAYDIAAIEYRGLNAVTNFDLSRYIKSLRPTNDNNPTTTTQNSIHNIKHPPSLNNVNVDFHQKLEPGLGFDSFSGQSLSSGSDTTSSGHVVPTINGQQSSALGLLLQSSKFKEMLEMTSTLDHCPLMTSSTESDVAVPRRSFPDDIQTYFACHHEVGEGSDDAIFSELNTFASTPIFHCELDV
ncbi:hypothetical protein ACFE04_031521 [Oxalis oulophora]